MHLFWHTVSDFYFLSIAMVITITIVYIKMCTQRLSVIAVSDSIPQLNVVITVHCTLSSMKNTSFIQITNGLCTESEQRALPL